MFSSLLAEAEDDGGGGLGYLGESAGWRAVLAAVAVVERENDSTVARDVEEADQRETRHAYMMTMQPMNSWREMQRVGVQHRPGTCQRSEVCATISSRPGHI